MFSNRESTTAMTTPPPANHGGAKSHAPLARPDLGQALAECRKVRRSIQSILQYAKRGAHDLHSGLSWSNSLARFEALSMEQARSLARFPVDADDPRFGLVLRRARMAFIDFRETVRREAISIIEPDIQETMLAEVLEGIDGKAAAAADGLETLERMLEAAQAR